MTHARYEGKSYTEASSLVHAVQHSCYMGTNPDTLLNIVLHQIFASTPVHRNM